jgi:hypothetical protein
MTLFVADYSSAEVEAFLKTRLAMIEAWTKDNHVFFNV